MQSKLNLIELLEYALELPYKKDDTGVLMALGQSAGLPLAKFIIAIVEIEDHTGLKAVHMMVNVIPPGVSVGEHIDTLKPSQKLGSQPKMQRWHLPLKTNPDCGFWEEGGTTVNMPYGQWYGPILYWKKHKVWNHGTTDRVHLIIDLE